MRKGRNRPFFCHPPIFVITNSWKASVSSCRRSSHGVLRRDAKGGPPVRQSHGQEQTETHQWHMQKNFYCIWFPVYWDWFIHLLIYFVLVTSLQNSCHERPEDCHDTHSFRLDRKYVQNKQNACSSFGHLAHTYHFGDFGPKELVLKHRRSWYWMIRWCISFLQIRALNFQPSKQGLQPLTLQPNSSQIFFHQTSCGRTVAMAFPGGIKVLESWLVPPSLRTCFKNDANLLSLKLLDAEVIPGSTSENLAWEWPLNSFFF